MTRAVDLANSVANGVSLGFKNRIINGAMMIDQRNAGASTTVTSPTKYTLDRYAGFAGADTGAGVFTVQQISDAPTGFTKSLRVTVTTTDTTATATSQYFVAQYIEGNNIADLAFGTAGASTITLSFWVKSSLTGTFAGGINNQAANRSYVFTYAISSANTWEYKTVTIPGDTTGTWLTDSGMGMRVNFNLGAGSTFQTTAGAWAATYAYSSSGAVRVIGTLNATWQITGVQLEVGSTATNFEYRDYGRELIMCQRYFYKTYNQSIAVASSAQYAGAGAFAFAPDGTCTNCHRYFSYPVSLRVSPTITGYSPNNGNTSNPIWNSGTNTNIPWNPFCANENGFGFHVAGSSVNIGTTCYLQMTASAEL